MPRERHEAVTQALVRSVRGGRSELGPIQLIVSWGMLNRLEHVSTHDCAVDRATARQSIDLITAIAIAGPPRTAPYVVLDGTGVIPLRDGEDRGVLETAFAGRARLLVTRNFKDFVGADAEVLKPNEVAVARRGDHDLVIAQPSVALRWMRHGAIELPPQSAATARSPTTSSGRSRRGRG